MNILRVTTIALVAAGSFVLGRSLPWTGSTEEVSVPAKSSRSAFQLSLRNTVQGASRSWLGAIELASRAGNSADWALLLGMTVDDPFLTRALVRRWASVDPRACWDYLLDLDTGSLPPSDLANLVFPFWAKQDPDGLMNAVFALPRSRQNSGKLWSLRWAAVKEILTIDLEGGMAFIRERYHGAPNDAWRAVEPWMEQDPEKASRLLADLSYRNRFRGALSRTSVLWFKQDPDGATSWLMTLPEDFRMLAIDQVEEEMRRNGDVERLLALAGSTDSDIRLQSLASPYLRHLRRTDPVAACQWIVEHFDGRTQGGMIGNVVRNIDLQELSPPPEFAPIFDQMPETYGKGEAAAEFLTLWATLDEPAAITWAASLPSRTLEIAAEGDWYHRWSRNGQARQWLRAAPDSALARRTLRSIVSQFNDPAEARSWARELPAERAHEVERLLGEIHGEAN